MGTSSEYRAGGPRRLIFFLRVFTLCAAAWLASHPAASQDADSDTWFYGKEIRNIYFDNLENVDESDLEGITGRFIGETFSDDIVSALYDRLFSLDYFEDIELRAARNADNGETVDIILSVVERPVVARVFFDGNRRIHDAEIRDAASLKEQDIFVESRVAEDERAIRNLYIGRGYSAATVRSSFERRDDGVYITFDIEEGRQTVVSEINFEGNSLVSARTLRSRISLKEAGLFRRGEFQETALVDDTATIETYYHDRGYADARVVNIRRERSFNEERNREEITLTFEILEGEQYTFGGITFEGNRIFSTEQLEDLVTLDAGGVYNETRFQQSRMNVQNLYYENGYTSNTFDLATSRDTDRRVISCTITITERPRSHVEHIIIQGNEKTRDFVILREIPLIEGDIFSNAKITNGLRNLYNLQYFSAVVPEVVQGSEEGLVDLVFTVEEQSTTSLNFGFTFSGVNDPGEIPVALTASVQDSNLFGQGRSASAGFTLSTSEQSVSGSIGENWFLGKPVSASLSLSYSRSQAYALRNSILPNGDISAYYDYMMYRQHEFGTSASLGRRWTPDFAILTLSGGVSGGIINNLYDDIWVPYDAGIANYHNNWQPTNYVWASFSMDGRNVAYDPSTGWFFSQRLAWYGLLPESLFNNGWGEREFYLRSDTKVERYFTLLDLPFTETWSLRLILMGYSGLSIQIPAFRSTIKKYNQLYIDGMFNGRGFEVYNMTAGRGQFMWSNTVELRVPLVPGVLALDLWADAVVIKQRLSQLTTDWTKNWYFSFGPGIRFLIQQFPLRLLFANTMKIGDGGLRAVYQNGDITDDGETLNPEDWWRNWHFVLSFNMTNR